MDNKELISTLHDRAMSLEFNTRYLIFEALKRLEALSEAPKEKTHTNFEILYAPFGVLASGKCRKLEAFHFRSKETAERALEEYKERHAKNPEIYEGCVDFKIMKRTVITTISEWEDV